MEDSKEPVMVGGYAKRRIGSKAPVSLKKIRAERKRSRMNVTKGRRQNGK